MAIKKIVKLCTQLTRGCSGGLSICHAGTLSMYMFFLSNHLAKLERNKSETVLGNEIRIRDG